MVRIRAIVSVLMLCALVMGLGVLSMAAQVWWSLPAPQGRLVRGPHDLVGVYAGRSYAWVVPTDDPRGVVLIDAGGERAATRILAELRKGQREVRAILLTHAHSYQTLGLEAFPDVPVYLAEAERPLLAGEVTPRGWLARLYAASVELPSELRLVQDGETVTIDGATFVAVATPGHTDGSVTWWWRDVVFTGGALLAANPPIVSPSGLNDDDEQALKSVERLLPLDFDVVADARTGLVTTARPQVHWMLGADVQPPERTLRGDAPDGPAVVERRGIYVETWMRGPDGHRPGLVVDPTSGAATVVAEPARPEHREFLGRRVVATGVPVDEPAVASDELAGVEIALEDDEAPSDGRLPLVTTLEALDALAHQWVVVQGTIPVLEPWTHEATHGEGRLRLADAEVPLSGPRRLPTETPVTLLARLVRDHPGPALIVAATCVSPGACRDDPLESRAR